MIQYLLGSLLIATFFCSGTACSCSTVSDALKIRHNTNRKTPNTLFFMHPNMEDPSHTKHRSIKFPSLIQTLSDQFVIVMWLHIFPKLQQHILFVLTMWNYYSMEFSSGSADVIPLRQTVLLQLASGKDKQTWSSPSDGYRGKENSRNSSMWKTETYSMVRHSVVGKNLHLLRTTSCGWQSSQQQSSCKVVPGQDRYVGPYRGP